MCFALTSCYKDFLDIKRDKSQVVPTQISHFQAILDNSIDMNRNSPHSFALIGTDEYHLTTNYWNILDKPTIKNGYIWNKEIYEGGTSDDWNYAYQRILISNLVMEGIEKIKPKENELQSWKKVKGSALFYRGINFYYLTQLFAEQYSSESKDYLGIPLRVESDPSLKIKRASLEETYQQILLDIITSHELLPEKVVGKLQPTKQAAKALLARIYLQMSDYKNALDWADKVIQSQSELMDYNDLDPGISYPFPAEGIENKEIIFMDLIGQVITLGALNVDTLLYNRYDDNDLRKSLLWEDNKEGGHTFRGSYCGGTPIFTGLALDEIYLIRAECQVRLGNKESSIKDINHLLMHRFVRDTYEPVSPSISVLDLLKQIFIERNKELVFRGLRWPDLKRLNKEAEFKITLSRKIGDKVFVLQPDDVRYVWPIPFDAVDIGGLQQNPR